MVRVDILVLFLILEEMLSAFHIEYGVTCRFVVYGLYYVEVCSIFAQVLDILFFNYKLVLNCVKIVSASMEMITWFLSFSLLLWYITLIDMQILQNPCIPGMNPT